MSVNDRVCGLLLEAPRLDSPAGLPPALYAFGGPEGADKFIAGLPGSVQRADAVWSGWWGSHGTVPPYAIAGGPFNTVCFDEAGGKAPSRDCSKRPQPLPPA